MADDIELNAASGTFRAATDEVGAGASARHFQRMKLDVGGDGLSVPVVSSDGTIPISGTVDLGATSLAALESITVGGTIDLGATSLAALESVTVGGTVELGSTSLAALENITVGGTVEIGATSLAALETITAAGVATETTLAALNAKVPAAGQAAMAASQPVAIASDQSTIPVNQAGVSATGSLGVLNAALALPLSGNTGFAVDVRGTFVATILIQGTIDGTNWTTLSVIPIGAGLNVAQVASVTAPGAWWGNANGFQQIRATVSAYTSGSATVTLRAMQAAGVVFNLPAGQTTQAVSGTVGVTGYPTAAASADALANPTVTKIDALGLLFNGTTWDRARNNINVVVETSAARTATGTGTTQTNFNARGVFVWINVTAVTGTTPTLTVRLQWSPDGGTTWVDLDTTNAQTVSITATGQHVLRVYPGMATAANASLNSILPRTWRLAWTIGGTTPSFTFAAQAAYVN